jgi:hypothetical protein
VRSKNEMTPPTIPRIHHIDTGSIVDAALTLVGR